MPERTKGCPEPGPYVSEGLQSWWWMSRAREHDQREKGWTHDAISGDGSVVADSLNDVGDVCRASGDLRERERRSASREQRKTSVVLGEGERVRVVAAKDALIDEVENEVKSIKLRQFPFGWLASACFVWARLAALSVRTLRACWIRPLFSAASPRISRPKERRTMAIWFLAVLCLNTVPV